jgi:hypothetical protein
VTVVAETELKAAEARGSKMLKTEPHATAARYDRATGRVVVELTNGCAYAFPAELVQDLHGASDADVSRVEVDGVGFNLHWPTLDVDLYVPALVSGIFGTRAWMARALARSPGPVTSAGKVATERTNGARGGRPRKAARG